MLYFKLKKRRGKNSEWWMKEIINKDIKEANIKKMKKNIWIEGLMKGCKNEWKDVWKKGRMNEWINLDIWNEAVNARLENVT